MEGSGGLGCWTDCIGSGRQLAYLSIREAQHRRQLLPVGLGHVLLNLKPLLQAFPLQVGEDGP